MCLEDNIVGLDLGTSSVRALLFDREFSSWPGLGVQKKYEFSTRPDGSVEVDPKLLLKLTCECLDALHNQMAERGLRAAGVAISTFWHCFLGLDRDENPTSPIVHLFDTRSSQQMEHFANTFDAGWIHAITGCMPHTSYWPAKLLWLREKRPESFRSSVRWISVGEFLLLTFTGVGAESTSMVSASGIWDHRKHDYCEEILNFIGIDRNQLAPVETLDEPRRELDSGFAARWPLFHGIPWYPAYGDGACNSIGSGCSTPQRFALMIGTSGAMRVVVKKNFVTMPPGIWCYRVNRERFILGGAISNGGEVFRWVTRTFRLPPHAEEQIAECEPGSHGLTVLPYFAGERSPHWRPDLRAAIVGMSLASKPSDILQACLESVALSFKQIYALLTRSFPAPAQVIASGGALLRSKVWPQMIADALDHPVVLSQAEEASSRGAAIIAAEQMGIIGDLDAIPPRLRATVNPNPKRVRAYERMLLRDERLFESLYGRNLAFEPPEQLASLGETEAPFSTA